MSRSRPSSAFYVAADSRHFLGLVALINSARLVGHDEPIYVGDCGLDESHRRRLAEHATIVPTNGPATPHLSKTVAPLANPSDVMILIDADIILTRSLGPLVDLAHSGKIVAFADRVAHRFDSSWSELLGLGHLRRQPYVNTGLVVAEGELGAVLLEQVEAGCAIVDVTQSCIADGSPDYPFYYLDQDVLNAYLATYSEDDLELLDHEFAPFPPFHGVRIDDERTLRCSYPDGKRPYLLHHVERKPWLTATRWNVYSELLARVLLEPDVALPLERDELPLRLRTGKLAWLEKRRNDALATLASKRGKLGIRRRLAVLADIP